MIKHLIFCLVLFGFVATPNQTSAQLENLQSGTQLGPEIVLDPPFPQPNEEVSVNIINSIYGAEITWLLNGKKLDNTKNKRQIKLQVGDPGETTVLTAKFKKQGVDISISKEVTPLYLDIILEPQTHVPEFYLGRSVPSTGSIVNATALLSGEKMIDSDLIYTWRIGRVVIDGGPMRKRNKISFEVPRGNLPLLSLEISDLNGNKIADKSMFIQSASPMILFYESNVLFGLDHNPIVNSLNLIGNTTVVRAEPYYLDSRVYNNPDILEWEIDNKIYQNSNRNPYEATLQKTGFSGRASLNVHVRDTTQFSQGAEEKIDINI